MSDRKKFLLISCVFILTYLCQLVILGFKEQFMKHSPCFMNMQENMYCYA